MMNSPKWISTLTITLVCAALATGCVKRVDYRGKAPDPKAVATLKAGQSTQEDVLNTIGSPSFETQYGPKVWYYVAKREEQKAFFTPETTNHETLAVSFNANGIVTKIEDLDPDQPKIIPVEDVTPGAVPEKPLVKQIFANFGRIAKRTEKDGKR